MARQGMVHPSTIRQPRLRGGHRQPKFTHPSRQNWILNCEGRGCLTKVMDTGQKPHRCSRRPDVPTEWRSDQCARRIGEPVIEQSARNVGGIIEVLPQRKPLPLGGQRLRPHRPCRVAQHPHSPPVDRVPPLIEAPALHTPMTNQIQLGGTLKGESGGVSFAAIGTVGEPGPQARLRQPQHDEGLLASHEPEGTAGSDRLNWSVSSTRIQASCHNS